MKKEIKRNFKERMCVNEASISQAQDSRSAKGMKRKSYLGDFEVNDMASPTKAKKVLSLAKEKSNSCNKKIKNLKKMTCRLKRKIGSFTEMLNELREKRLISDSASSILQLSLPGSAKELLNRIAQGNSREKYSPQLRAFALTLNFYSVKAYDYVRKTFNCNLPHSATLRKWYQCIDGSPGLTSEAFTALKVKAEDAAKKQNFIKGCLIIDEMAIRSHIEWDKDKFTGYVEMGTNIDDDQLPHAKEAFTFMVNCINGNWKVPVGYFLINGLNAIERANLITLALREIHETGVEIVALTFDGSSTNFATANVLGANLCPESLLHFFLHPVTNKPIYLMLDASHMLKLVRNALASKGSMFDGTGGFIQWNHIVHLEKVQKKEGLYAATKIRARHIEWYREKMKVKLAAQVLSRSVADALAYLSCDLKLPEFKNCEPTINFVKIFNDLFDILNSRNLLSKDFKAPFQDKNKDSFMDFLNKAEHYIKNLKTSANGEPILSSNRKTGFLGFIICIKSVRSLYYKLCENSDSPMKFLMTYKLSQDHIEMFFSSIRSKGGYNNNPTAKQFKAAYVRLLAHHEILTSDNANCTLLDRTNILNVASSSNIYINKVNEQLNDDNYSQVESLELSHRTDHTYAIENIKFEKIGEYAADVVSYVAGFIVKKLKSTLKCPECYLVLTEEPTMKSRLTVRKNRGGLVFPSDSTIKICKIAEKIFRTAQASGKLLRKNIMHLLIVNGLKEVMSCAADIFSNLNNHSLDQSPLENHRLSMMKAIFFEYFKIRLYHVGKLMTENLQTNRIRNLNLKATLFKGQ